MRTLIILSLAFCAVNAFRLSELRPQGRLNLSPRSECVGMPNGTQLPHPSNCQQFILCENNSGLTLSCRSSHPHFDRCNGRCVDDVFVCMITDCPDNPTPPPTPPTTGPPTDTTTTPVIPTAPPEETTTPTETTTTTVFVVPTVPS